MRPGTPGAYVVQRRGAVARSTRRDGARGAPRQRHVTVRTGLSLQEAVMPRGDELNEELRFSDRDDDADDLGYGGGGSSSYDDDDEEDGGWTTNKDDSDDLWDSTDDADDDDEEGLGTPVVEGDDEEEESPLVVARAPRSAGRPAGGGATSKSGGGGAAKTPVTPSKHPATAEPPAGKSAVVRGNVF